MIGLQRNSIVSFFVWWHRALRESLPGPLRALLGPVGLRLTVDFDDDSLTMTGSEGGERIFHDDLSANVPAQRRSNRFDAQAIRILRLPERYFVEHRIKLPKLGKREIGEAVKWRVGKLSPFPEANTLFSYLADQQGGSETAISILLGERQTIEQAEATARRAAGIEDFDVVTLGSEKPGLEGYNFRPQALRRRLLRLYARPASILALVILALVANLQIYADRLDIEADAIEQKSGEWSQRAGDLMQSVDQVNASIAAYRQVNDRAKNQRGLSFALADLTELLPDSSYLTEMRYRANQIRIAGFSDSAARLIALIETHPSFDSAQFNAPVVRDPTSNLERFDLSFRWRSSPESDEKAGHEES